MKLFNGDKIQADPGRLTVLPDPGFTMPSDVIDKLVNITRHPPRPRKPKPKQENYVSGKERKKILADLFRRRAQGLGESPYTETPNKPSTILDPTNIAGQTAAYLQKRQEAWKLAQEMNRPTPRQPGRPDPMFDSNPLEYRPPATPLQSAKKDPRIDSGFSSPSPGCPPGTKFVCLRSKPPQCYCDGAEASTTIDTMEARNGDAVKIDSLPRLMPMPAGNVPWSGGDLILKPVSKPQVWGDTVVTPTISRVSGEDQLRAAAKEMTSVGMPVYGTAPTTNLAEPVGKGTTTNATDATNATNVQASTTGVSEKALVSAQKEKKSWILPVVGAVVLLMLFSKRK